MNFIIRQAIIHNWKKAEKSDNERKAGQTVTPGVARERDIVYIPDGHPLHKLDVFYPEGTTGLLPTIFDIHGGGWMYGDKELNENFCASLASRGFTVVDMSYRLVPQVELKQQVEDVFAALTWLADHGTEHHCALDKVFLTGDSAGGHLASLAQAITLSPELCALYEVDPIRFPIHALALNHAVADLHGPMFGNAMIDNEYRRLIFGGKPEHNPVYAKSSIMDTGLDESYPPILVITSDPDPLHQKTVELVDFLSEQGHTFEMMQPDMTGPDSARLGHVFNVLYPEWPESMAVNDRIAEFFKDSVRPVNAQPLPEDSDEPQ